MSENQTVTMARKLSTKTIGYGKTDIQKLLAASGKAGSVHLYNVAGVAKGVEHGESAMGEWTRFKGDFVAIKPDGERIQSNKLHVAEPFQSALESAVTQVDPDTGELRVKAVEFAIEVHAKADETSATGYTYDVKPIVKVQENDAVSRLAEQFGKMKALPKLPE